MSAVMTHFSPVTNVSETLLIKTLLYLFNISGMPTPDSSITSEARSIALSHLDGLAHPDTKRFFYRVLSARFDPFSQEKEGDRWDGYYLSIPWSFITKAYHRDVEKELPVLVELGILESRPYSSTNHVCKGYRVVWDKLVDVFSKPVTMDTPKVFLALPESKAKPTPSDIARDAAKSIPTGQMNWSRVVEYFDRKSNVSDTCLSFLINDLECVFGCWANRKSFDKLTGILTYNQSYHTTEIGGRVYASSGDQRICRELKSYWFDIPNVYNYDIKGCHISLFNQIHPTEFATKWVSDNSFRAEMAEKVGIPISLMKRGVLALTYGAMPTAHRNCEIYKLFLEHFGDRIDLAKASLKRFAEVTKDYRDALRCWHKSIKDNPNKYQTNAIGLVTKETKPASLASHYLMGLEQQAIRWLSSKFNQTRHQYEVISNQFDGLVTVGKIPESIFTKFTQKFNLTIEIKPIY